MIPIEAGQAAAAKWGMEWGGDFRGTPDPMHFEIHLSPPQITSLGAAAAGTQTTPTVTASATQMAADDPSEPAGTPGKGKLWSGPSVSSMSRLFVKLLVVEAFSGSVFPTLMRFKDVSANWQRW